MQLITAKQASELLSIRLPRLYELARLEVIPIVRLGPRQIRFDEAALAAWAKRGGIVERSGRGNSEESD